MLRTMLLTLPLLLAGCADNDAQAGGQEKAAAPAVASTTAASAEADMDAVVATWNGGQLTYGDLHEKVAPQLTSMEIEYLTNRYNAESQALEMLLMEKLLETEAKNKGVADIETLLETEVENKITPPSAEEVESFYPMVARQLRGMPKEEALPIVAQELTRRRQSERYVAYIDELKAQNNAATTLPFPDMPRIEVPVLEHDPVRGNADAEVTIVQFAEYQCGYCAKAMPTIDQIFEKYDGKVRMVYKDFPLDFHDKARGAAIAAHCAGEQEKYWEMHDQLMTHQQALSRTDLLGYASELSLDDERFAACLDSDRFDEAIDADLEAGRLAGVSGTPAFFINGVMLSGAQPFEKFESVIERELQN